jgi:hypothetical protein
MKFKNINPVERYFEKLVVLAALGGSFYFVYASYVVDPNLVGDNVKPGEIEARVSQALDNYNEALKHEPPYKPEMISYVDDYIRSTKNPLPADLLKPAPTFAPLHLAIEIGPGGGGGEETIPPIAMPTVPPLINQKISSDRTVVNMPVPGSATATTRRDLTYVKGTADLKIADLDEGIKKIPIPTFQKTAIYRIHVQRSEQLEDGSWTPFADLKPLHPLPALDPNTPVKALPDRANEMRGIIKNIIEPEFYVRADAKVDVAPVIAPPKVEKPPVRPPQRPAQPAPRGNPRFGGALAPNGAPGHAPPTWNPGLPPEGQAPPIPPPAIPGAPVDLAAGAPGLAAGDDFFGLAGVDTVPVWFWDDQVQPEHTYRYQARVEIINPLYQLPKGLQTIPPEGKNNLLLASEYVKFDPVTVEADEYYFLTPDNLTAHAVASASFKIYKWHENLWYSAEDRVEPGMTVGGKKSVIRAGQAKVAVDFGAVYTVIDIQSITTPTGGQDVLVILLNNTTGRLVLRDLLSDSRDPQKQKLDDLIRKQTLSPVSAGPTAGNRAE